MPLLRQSLYSQNVNLYLTPTADGRDTWVPLMRTIASEGRCFVLSANQCVRKRDMPSWITGKKEKVDNVEVKHMNGIHDSPPRLRRKSTIIADGNEIVLPAPKEETVFEKTLEENYHHTNARPGVSHSRRKSTIIEDGNEIALPSPKLEKETEKKPAALDSEFISHGGSCIVSPLGEVLAGPIWDDEKGLLTVDVDFEDCLRGRLDLDVAGHYSRYVHRLFDRHDADLDRNDSFKLTVDGLDLNPPP